MGHIRLGRLPKSKLWKEVVALLDGQPEDVPGIAAAVLDASSEALERPSTIATASRSFLILIELAQAAQRGELVAELRSKGVEARADTPLLAALAEVSENVRTGSGGVPSDNFTDFGNLALRRALLETMGSEASLFGSSVQDLEAAFRRHTRGDGFGRLTKLFFGDFIARSLHSALDREQSRHVGGEQSFANVGESRAFSDALDKYARETAFIVQRFATDWYAQHHWQRKETLGPRHARAFTAVALKKLRSDLAFAREPA